MSGKDPVSITIDGETEVIVPPVECDFCGEEGHAVIGDGFRGKKQIKVVCKEKHDEIDPTGTDKIVEYL